MGQMALSDPSLSNLSDSDQTNGQVAMDMDLAKLSLHTLSVSRFCLYLFIHPIF